MTTILETKSLCIGYGAEPVLRGVSLSVHTGSIVAILGRNGAGKSTLLRGVAGVLEILGGSVEFLGQDIRACGIRERVRRGLEYVAQGRECFLDLSVSENLNAAMVAAGVRRARRNEHLEWVLKLFTRLAAVQDESARRLSGGLQQMLVLAMAFAQQPKCLLLDEPSLGLSPKALQELEHILKAFVCGGGSILLAEQKPQMIFRIAAYAYYLEHGQAVLEGAPGKLRENPEFVRRYLGLKNAWRSNE